MEEYKKQFSLSKDDTLILKGIAICAMLCHHLFTCVPQSVDVSFGMISLQLGNVGKMCVALFLFLSGYGLSIQYKKLNISKIRLGEVKFILKRFVKFYTNYWVIYFFFVPIGVFVFGRPLQMAYGESVNLCKRLFLDLLGVQGFSSYNITWWFNKLIIILYLLFPILYWCMKKCWFLTLLPLFLWMKFKLIDIYVLDLYAFPFALGIFCALYSDSIQEYLKKIDMSLLKVLSVCFFVFLVVHRQLVIIPYMGGIRIDGFLSLNLALIVVLFANQMPRTGAILKFLGKHSINIYMIHTFIYFYWYSNYVYSLKYAILVFVSVLSICLLLSVLLELFKEKCGVYYIMNKLLSYL